MNGFDEVLVNIRSAFRLLYFFNERILSLMKYVEKTFGISCVWDKAHYIEPPIQNKNNLSKRGWGWSWLPFLFYEFHFQKDEIHFSIFLQSDTGAWAVDNWHDVDSFSDITESKTRLLFAVSNAAEWDSDIIVGDNYTNLLRDECSMKISKDNNIFVKAFDLSEFRNETETKNALRKFVSFVKNKGIANIEFVDE